MAQKIIGASLGDPTLDRPAALARHSATLACLRLTGRHTFSSIAEKLHSVHRSFHTALKIMTMVTDNASNFVSAFKELACTDDDNDDTMYIYIIYVLGWLI